MNHFILLLASLVTCLNFTAANLIVKDLPLKAYEADQFVSIQWQTDSVTTCTIELTNDRPEVILESLIIAENVSSRDESYSWRIPRYLRSSDDYHFQLRCNSKVFRGSAFKIVNSNPSRSSTLNLLEPTGSADGTNLESTCLLGEQCFIVWEYPEWAESAMPKFVDIKLYAGNEIVLVIAENVNVRDKSYTWTVPTYTQFKESKLHVVISASGKNLPTLAPGSSYYLASSGYPFKLETRAEREQRRIANSQKRDFTAPGPILNESESKKEDGGFLDVPRPTYAPSNNNNNQNVATATSAAAKSVQVHFGILLISSIIFAFSI